MRNETTRIPIALLAPILLLLTAACGTGDGKGATGDGGVDSGSDTDPDTDSESDEECIPPDGWESLSFPSWLNDVWVAPDGVAFMISEDTIWRASTAGTEAFVLPAAPLCGRAHLWGTGSTDVFAACENGQVFHWGGAAWIQNRGLPELNDAWVDESGFAVVVGGSRAASFDGSAWTEMAGEGSEQMKAVWGASPSDVFAVGWFGRISHFDGGAWSPMDTGGAWALVDVWGTSPTNVYAVGGGAIVHYDGTGWTAVDFGGGADHYQFEAVIGDAPDNVMVVGYAWGEADFPQEEWTAPVQVSWDGASWEVSLGMVDTDVYTGGAVFASGHLCALTAGDMKCFPNGGGSAIVRSTLPYTRAVFGSSPDDFIAVASSGQAARFANDDGTPIDLGTAENLTSINGNSAGLTLIVGERGGIFRDGGSGWVIEGQHHECSGLMDIGGHPAVGTYALCFEPGWLLRQEGEDWIEMSVGTLPTENLQYSAISVDSSGDLWISGYSGWLSGENDGIVSRFHADAWTHEQWLGPDEVFINSIWSDGGGRALAAGERGFLAEFDGSVWADVPGFEETDFGATWGVAGGDFYAVGYDDSSNRLVRLGADGTTVTDLCQNGNVVTAMSGVDDSDLWIVGSYFAMHKLVP